MADCDTEALMPIAVLPDDPFAAWPGLQDWLARNGAKAKPPRTAEDQAAWLLAKTAGLR